MVAAAPITTDAASDFVGCFIESLSNWKVATKKDALLRAGIRRKHHLCYLWYQPTTHAMLIIVDDLLSKLPPSEIIMGMDINASVGCNLQEEDDPFAPALGPHGISKHNLKGKNLLGVYMSHGLRVMNTYYPEKCDIGYGMWTSTLNGKQSMLDVIVCLANLHKHISNCQIILDGLESNHCNA